MLTQKARPFGWNGSTYVKSIQGGKRYTKGKID